MGGIVDVPAFNGCKVIGRVAINQIAESDRPMVELADALQSPTHHVAYIIGLIGGAGDFLQQLHEGGALGHA